MGMAIHLDKKGLEGTTGDIEFSLEGSAFLISVR